MTQVILHGTIAHEFGKVFYLKLQKANQVLRAMDCMKDNFILRINELSRQGFNYVIIVDGEKIMELNELAINKIPKQIHIVPLIVGSGAVLGAAIISGVAGAMGISAVATTAFLATTMGTIASAVVGGLVTSVITMGLQMLLAPKPDAGPQISSTTKALSESFNFSNKANSASQGSPVPVGYGRLKVGSQVIQSTIVSYPREINAVEIMRQNPVLLQDNVNYLSIEGTVTSR